MGEDRLENLIRNKVAHHRSQNDGEALWAKIQQQQLEEKRSKRRLLGWWIFGIGALVLSGIYFFNGFNEGIKNVPVKLDVPVKVIDHQSPSNSEKDIALTTKGKKPEYSKENFTRALNKSSDKEISEKATIEKRTKTAKLGTREESRSPDLKEPVHVISVVDNPKVKESRANNFGIKEIQKSKYLTHLELIQKSPLLQLKEISQKEKEVVDILPLHFFEKLNLNHPDLLPNTQNDVKNWNFSIDAFFHYGANFKQLTPENDSSKDYQKLRETTEKRGNNIRTGIQLGIQHKSHLFGKIGLEYQQINEEFNISTREINTFLAPDQLIQILIHSDGTTTEVRDSGFVTDIVNIEKRIFNRYKMIDLPILLGYEKEINSRWKYYIEAGAALNISFKINGEIVDEFSEAYSLNSDNRNWFKNRIGLAFMGGIGVRHLLTDQWSLWTSPSFKYYLSDFGTNENLLNENHFSLGLSLGISREF